MKYLIIMTLLFGIFGCNNNVDTNVKVKDEININNEIKVKSECEIRIDSIDVLIKSTQIEADSICLSPRHIFEKCDSKLRELYRERGYNNSGFIIPSGEMYYISSGIHQNYNELPSKIIDYDDRTEIVTTKIWHKYCYRCMNNIEFKKETTEVIWNKD